MAWRTGFGVRGSRWLILFGLLVLCLHGSDRAEPAEQKDFYRHNSLGIGYLDQHNWNAAIGEFKEVLKIRPDYLPAIVNLGLAYNGLSQYDDAIRTFERALEINPNDPYCHYNLGMIYKMKGEFDKAAEELQKVIEVDPDDPSVRYNLGMVYSKQGRIDEAVREFNRVIELVPDGVAAYYGLFRALISAKREEYKEVLARFQELKKSGAITEEAEKYLTEGKYFEPMVVLEESPSPEPLEVRFLDVTSSSGLRFHHGSEAPSLRFSRLAGERSPDPIGASEYSTDFKRSIIRTFGSGAAFGDYDNDGDLDLYIVNCSDSEKRSANVLYSNNGDGTFTDVTVQAGVGDRGMGMGGAFGDYDGDKDLDLYVTNYGANVLYQNNGDGTFTDVTQKAGVGHPGWSAGVAFADYDHDGDLDIYVANYVDLEKTPPGKLFRFPRDFIGQPNVLYRNNGDGTFLDVAEEAGVTGGQSRSLGVAFFDFDNDRALDFYVVNDGDPNALYRNNRDGTFTDVSEEAGVADRGGGRGIALGDENRDGYTDIYVTNRGGEANILYWNNGDGTFKSRQLVELDQEEACWGAGFIDFDNDSDLDLFVAVDPLISSGQGGRSGLLFRNEGDGTSVDVSSSLGQTLKGAARGVTFGDFDSDGDTDIFIVNNGGVANLLRNEGGNRNNWLKLKLIGDKSNWSGIGVKVDTKAGSLWQRKEIVGSSSYLSSAVSPVLIGLNGEEKADVVRVLWPRGIRQSLTDVPANQSIPVIETSVEPPSCPVLFAWDGSKYTFVTDFIGNSVVGYYLAPDTDEYVKIEGSQLRPKDGLYSISVFEPLGEITFLDEAKLLVVDHPSEVDVYPNERFQFLPPFPKFRIVVAKGARPPIRALDDRGDDILPLIAERDRTYPEGFELLRWWGFAGTHSITLDLGDLSGARKIELILYGYVIYSSFSSNLAAAQAGIEIRPPELEVMNSQGQWETAVEDMGFPAGKPKYMVVDLTGRFPADDYRVRITTNMPIYWDQILVNTFSEEVPITVTKLSPSSADVRWKGYPRLFSPDGKKPPIYDYYHEASEDVVWVDQAGDYTRYGDVTPLLQKADDMYVIMRHGDEVAINFDATSLQSLPEGWSRDFFFYADGFIKDADLNSNIYCSTVEPLPFHGMSGYPYGEDESYPSDEEHLEYIVKYNTRRISGEGGFAFR